MSGQAGQDQQTCHLCGGIVPVGALYCPSCGARQTHAADASPRSFEDAIASVLGDESDPAPTAPSGEASEPSPATFEPVSATPPPLPLPATQGWATADPAAHGGWPAFAADQAKASRNRTLWIVLAVFGFIVFCCCGATFVSVAVAAA